MTINFYKNTESYDNQLRGAPQQRRPEHQVQA